MIRKGTKIYPNTAKDKFSEKPVLKVEVKKPTTPKKSKAGTA
jgi:hypothetical protein